MNPGSISRLLFSFTGALLLCTAAGCTGPNAGAEDGGALADLTGGGGGGDGAGAVVDLGGGGDGGGGAKFSFFVSSMKAMVELSGSNAGFGGDLRFGETGAGAGLRGADKLCATIAERSMVGAGKKPWRAFLSAVSGEDGKQVNALDRIGSGPWYDRRGRLVSANLTDIKNTRPKGADPTILNDLPNEDGVPNHRPDPNQPEVDNHDILTGTNSQGQLYSKTATCLDWTSALGNTAMEGRPRVGHSWPRGSGATAHWMSSLDEAGCKAGINIIEMGPPDPRVPTVGSGGGYGGIYCFSLVP